MMRDRKIPEIQSSSHPPEKPARPPSAPSGITPPRDKSDITVLTDRDMIVETCSCGSSISMPHFFTGQEEARKNWREEHKHSDFPFARACPDPSIHEGIDTTKIEMQCAKCLRNSDDCSCRR